MEHKRLAQLATVKWGKINQEVRGEVLSSARNNENAVSEMRTRGCCQCSTLIDNCSGQETAEKPDVDSFDKEKW